MGDIVWDDEKSVQKPKPEAPASAGVKWDDEQSQPQAMQAAPTPPIPSNYTNTALEMLKGAGRGFVGITRAIGKGIAPPPESIPEQYRLTESPGKADIEAMNQKMDSMLAPSPTATDAQKNWGVASEIAGGMFAPGAGMARGMAAAGQRGIQAALGPGANEFAIPGLTGVTRHYPTVPVGGEEAAARTAGRGLPDWLGHAINSGLYAIGVPKIGRLAARYAYGAVSREMRNGSTPAEALYPPHKSPLSPQAMERIMQGAATPLFTQGDE